MLTKTITFTNFADPPVTKTETYHFHMSRAEIIELEVGSHKAGFRAMMQAIIESGDNPEILAQFKRLLLMSVGRKSADGDRFEKNQQIRDEFEQSNAYDEMIVSFFTDPDTVAEFVKGIMPENMPQDQDKPAGPPPAPLSTLPSPVL